MMENTDSKSEHRQTSPTGGRDVTILLLGETGVGKSTWINGFANFLEFESLEEAEQNPTLCLIPASFTITDDNYEERRITTGQDVNEVTEVGQSATQHPQTYSFRKDGYTVRLIDTPGIGDVRGADQDKKNFELILDHISHLSDLNAICILLKPNNAKLNIMFSFCIKELLTHLHRDACRNLVFCFTNSRSTFYRPGDTLPALRKLLEGNKDVQIQLNYSTLYCMDNEAVRFLYAFKNGINFSPEERNNYKASWEKSVLEISRLLKNASELQPHLVKDTLCLNNARQTILALGNPMVAMIRDIQMNIAAQEMQKEELLNSKKSKAELCQNLFTLQYDVRMRPLDEPRTICTAVKCVDFIKVGNQTEINYKTHCHQGCGTGKKRHFKIANIVGHKKLRKCSAFDSKGNCKHCGCSWKEHMKITYETVTEVQRIPNQFKEVEIQNEEIAIQNIQKFLTARDQNLKELRDELVAISEARFLFARFLKSNAITPYNDCMDAYLMHFITEEQKKIDQGEDSKVLEGMKKMRVDYQKQMDILEFAMQKGTSGAVVRVTPADLEKSVQNLYRLKHSGKKLRDMMIKSQSAETVSYTEKLIERTESFTSTTKTTETAKPYKNKSSLWSQIVGSLRSPDPIGSTTPFIDTTDLRNKSPGQQGSKFRDNNINNPTPQGDSNKLTNSPQTSVVPPIRPRRPAPTPPVKPQGIMPSGYSASPQLQVNGNVQPPPPPPVVPHGLTRTPEAIRTLPVNENAKPPGPPPPPPLNLPDQPAQILPVPSGSRASLLEQIRKPRPNLRKTQHGEGYDPLNFKSNKFQTNRTTKAEKPCNGYGDINESLKRALEGISLRVQDSDEDNNDGDDGRWA